MTVPVIWVRVKTAREAVKILVMRAKTWVAGAWTARTLTTRQSKICGVTALWRAVAMAMEVRKVLVKEA